MEVYLIIAMVGILVVSVVMFVIGKKSGSSNSAKVDGLEARVNELQSAIAEKERHVATQVEEVKKLTSERDVERTKVENLAKQLDDIKESYDKQLAQVKDSSEKQIYEQKVEFEKRVVELQTSNTKQVTELKTIHAKQLNDMKESYDKQLAQVKDSSEKQIYEQKVEFEKRVVELQTSNTKQVTELKTIHAKQLDDMKESYDKQLAQVKDSSEKQLEALRELNNKQVKSQLELIKEQMKATSESVLKARQEELGERNKEQVSKIIDPLQKSLKDMEEAFNKTKLQQHEAFARLDETIKINMQKSVALGETADRLTRALTGEVKVQGNFGELKLKQLLEDLELKEGEQYDTQETLRDRGGRVAKSDEGKGLIPDFILHFPNNRHVVVDAKMSLTDYERYMNSEEGVEKTDCLKAHLHSVREQVKRLAKKDYTRYLPEGYNRLNFAIMYVPIEGALNLALLNDVSLWREAYDQGVMILGPQTMYMNLRVLEVMWTQVRQLKNQQAMMDAANKMVERVQDFGVRFMDVETAAQATIKKITELKKSTADSGQSIITAARQLIKAGAQESKKKKSLNEIGDSMFIDTDETLMLPPEHPTSFIESSCEEI